MRKICLALAAAAALFSALPLAAHHAVSAEFDSSKVVTLKGVVSKVDWVNPHIFVYFDVKDESGKVTTWRLQSAAAHVLQRQRPDKRQVDRWLRGHRYGISGERWDRWLRLPAEADLSGWTFL